MNNIATATNNMPFSVANRSPTIFLPFWRQIGEN